MTAELSKQENKSIARPLKVLVPLIKQDLAESDKIARPFYEAVGQKLIEAKEGHFEGDTRGFFKWAEKEFGKSSAQITTYMAYTGSGGAKSFKSLRQVKYTKKEHGGEGKTRPLSRSWTEPVDEVAARARLEAHRLMHLDVISHNQERDAQRKLAARLIDIGFKVLVKELHPDKGGSKEAMRRLNIVRNTLKHAI